MNAIQIELFVAARGLSHASWMSDFYPDDLPEDWRLSFYSNEFRAIVLPASLWVNIDPLEIERWEEDTQEEFLFFIEVEDLLTDWKNFAQLIQPLGEQLGGILLRPQRVDADLSMLATNIVSAAAIAPTSLLLPEGVEPNVTGLGLLDQHGVDLCWNVGEKDPRWLSPCTSGLAVARVAGNMTFTARQWRETIETALQQVAHKLSQQTGANPSSENQCPVLLMIDTDAPLIKDLRSATLIGDMLVMPSPL